MYEPKWVLNEGCVKHLPMQKTEGSGGGGGGGGWYCSYDKIIYNSTEDMKLRG